MDLSHEDSRKTDGASGYDFFQSLALTHQSVMQQQHLPPHPSVHSSESVKRESSEHYFQGGEGAGGGAGGPMLQPPDAARYYGTRVEGSFHDTNFHHSAKPPVQSLNCQLCMANFSEISHLDRHYTLVHRTGQNASPHVHLPTNQRTDNTEPVSAASIEADTSKKNSEKSGGASSTGSTDDKHNCKICGKYIRHEHNLARHMLIHGTVKSYDCPHCPKNFRRQDHLRVHVKSCHTPNGKYKEGAAPKPRKPKRESAAALTGYSAKKTKAAHNKAAKAAVVSSSLKTQFVCQICNKSLSSLSNLQRHHLIHTNIRPFPCNICNKGFRQKVQLDKHCEAVHSKDKPLPKKKGPKGSSKNNIINNNINNNNNNNNSHHDTVSLDNSNSNGSSTNNNNSSNGQSCKYIYVCELCRKPLSSIHSLMRHKMIHFNVKPYQCPQCPRHFKRNDHLNVHMSTCHGTVVGANRLALNYGDGDGDVENMDEGMSDEKEYDEDAPDDGEDPKYVCEICNKAYRYKSGIDRHRLIHEDLKPFACPHCVKSFRRKDHLFNHIKSLHKGQGLPT